MVAGGRYRRAGFTLVELLVAVAIFGILMTAVATIFFGSVRAARTGYQQMDAFERARGALTVLQDDLVSCYVSPQTGDVSNFYGTPIGMTFIATARNTSNPADVHVSRITYVIYNCWKDEYFTDLDDNPGEEPRQSCREPFPEALEYVWPDGHTSRLTGYPYWMLRYVEPDVTSLDALPFSLGDPLPVQQGTIAQTYGDLVDRLFRDEVPDEGENWNKHWNSDVTTPGLLTQEDRDHFRAKTYDLWIRMLAGGDNTIPVHFWRDVLPMLMYAKYRSVSPSVSPEEYKLTRAIARNYIVTENVLSIASPEQRAADPYGSRQGGYTVYFDYDYAFALPPLDPLDSSPLQAQCTGYGTGDPVFKYANSWWNDGYGHSLNCTRVKDWRNPCLSLTDQFTENLTGIVYCEDPRLPEIVTISFWLMFERPYPSAPDFKRLFSLQVNLPTGYTRQNE